MSDGRLRRAFDALIEAARGNSIPAIVEASKLAQATIDAVFDPIIAALPVHPSARLAAFKHNAPRRVDDRYRYWTQPPPEPSERCKWWQGRIEAGWRPNRRIRVMGYDERAQHMGVYIWEYLNVLSPLLTEAHEKYQQQASDGSKRPL